MTKKINTKQAIPYGISVILAFFSFILQFLNFVIIYFDGKFMPHFGIGFPINYDYLTYMFELGFHPEYLCFFISSVLYFFVPLTLMLVIAGKYLIDNFKPEYSKKFNYLLALPFALLFIDRLIVFCGNAISTSKLFTMSIIYSEPIGILSYVITMVSNLLLMLTPAIVIFAILVGFKKPKFNFVVFISPIIALVILILAQVLSIIGNVLLGAGFFIDFTTPSAQFFLYLSIACVYAIPVLKAIKERKSVTR